MVGPCSGRFRKKSAQAADDWKFVKSSKVFQSGWAALEVNQEIYLSHECVRHRKALTENVGGLLGVIDHPSQRCVTTTVHCRKGADMDVGVVYRPRRPLLLPW